MSHYQPGYCNIGPRQRRQRLAVALVSFVAAAGYALACVVGPLPEVLLVGVFVPLAIGFEWGFQAYTAFCVRLALLNRYDFRGEPGGKRGTVSTASDHQADTIQAAKITTAALLVAGVTTLLLFVVVV